MSSNSKAESPNASGSKQATLASPTMAQPSTPTIKHKRKQPHLLNPKLGPAVKDLTRSRSRLSPAIKNVTRPSKPTASQKTESRGLTVSKLPSNETRIKVTNLRDLAGDHKQTARDSRRDPYELVSDSEANDRQRSNFTPAPPYSHIPSPADAGTTNMGASMNPKRAQPSTPVLPAVKPSVFMSSSQGTRTSRGPQHSRPRTPATVPLNKQIILLDSSSNEDTSSHVTRKCYSESKRRSGVGLSMPAYTLANSAEASVRCSQGRIIPPLEKPSRPHPVSRQRTAAKIPAGAEIITITGSSSESDTEQLGGKVSTSVHSPSKTIKQRSRYPVNSHLSIIDKEAQGTTSLPTDSALLSKKTRRDSIALQGGYASIHRHKQEHYNKSLTSPNSNSLPPLGESTPANEKHTISQKHAEIKQPQKIDQGPSSSKFQNTNNNSNCLVGSDESADTATQQRTTASRQRISRDKHKIQRRSSPNNIVMKAVQNTPTEYKTFNVLHGSEQDQGQSKLKESKEVINHGANLGDSGISATATKDVKKIAKGRFEKKEKYGIISESLFEEPNYSDDEYQLVSDNKEQSSEDSGDELSLHRRARAIKNMTLLSSPGRKLRSRSYPKPTTSFTPINKPTPGTQERKSTTTSPRIFKLGKCHSNRIRITTDTTDSDSNGSREGRINKKDDKPTEFERKSWWDPQAWIERYETGFMIDFNVADRLWLGIGPFKGWISDGPGKGTYMPGYGPPDDATIAEAEKTAVLRYHLRTYDSDSEDHEQWERDYFPDKTKPCENEGSSAQLALGMNQGMKVTGSPECPTTDSREEELHCIAPSTDPDQATLLKRKALSEAKAIERAERAERTEQYVLTGTPSGRINSQDTDSYGPISSRTRGKLSTHRVPTTKPDDTTSPSSAASETTSTLITRQLIADCTSLSSPMNRRTKASSSARHVNERCNSDDEGSSSISSSELSSGILARLSRETSSLPPASGRGQSMSVGLEYPNAKPEWFIPPKTSTKTNIEVMLPSMSVEERAGYDVVSPVDDDESTPLPPTSFKEINKATPSLSPESDGSGEETLNYVLRQSPLWLHNITEMVEPRDTITDMANPSSKSPVKSSSKRPSVDLESLRSPREPRRHLFTATAAGNSQAGQHFSSETKRKEKRKAASTGFPPPDESPASKKQKADNYPSFKKPNRLGQNCRRRMRIQKEKQMQNNNSQIRICERQRS
ncbi:hypothetical protein F4813DRAFT_320636 [Daldinia decipiens]|uniref:uncharacterized protein n=1 Tax=Daldinia decipiens TaxID=326647 RepID=UPI0020C2C489|nr:uncharacterized protein F4813DRAFT_320636 [Daldinia decipiens]KAI1652418.1 hypothetical protein F4813DRAFT_320636 [Daldinia decipiens]